VLYVVVPGNVGDRPMGDSSPAFAIAMLSERRSLPYLGQQSLVFPSNCDTLRDPVTLPGNGDECATTSVYRTSARTAFAIAWQR